MGNTEHCPSDKHHSKGGTDTATNITGLRFAVSAGFLGNCYLKKKSKFCLIFTHKYKSLKNTLDAFEAFMYTNAMCSSGLNKQYCIAIPLIKKSLVLGNIKKEKQI